MTAATISTTAATHSPILIYSVASSLGCGGVDGSNDTNVPLCTSVGGDDVIDGNDGTNTAVFPTVHFC